MLRSSLIALAALATSAPTFAASVLAFAPQGVVISQSVVEATFETPMVAAGQQRDAPFVIECPVDGTSYWTNDKRWTYRLTRRLNSGESCTFKLSPHLKDLANRVVGGKSAYSIKGRPLSVDRLLPSTGSTAGTITPDQVFIAEMSAEVDEASLQRHIWCKAEGVDEKIPVSMQPGDLQRLRLRPEWSLSAGSWAYAFSCRQALPSGAKAAIVFEPGIAGTGPLVTPARETFKYVVQKNFAATFSCSRAQKGASCDPFSAASIIFNRPVKLVDAFRVNLVIGGAARTPTRKELEFAYENSETVNGINFAGPFPEQERVTLTVPKDLHDLDGNSLTNSGKYPLNIQFAKRGPLGKFPGDFGILELKEGGVLPLTVRRIEKQLALSSQSVDVDIASVAATQDAEVIAMMGKFNEINHRPAKVAREYQDGREYSFFAQTKAGQRKKLPAPRTSGDLEVLGLPLAKPGFYVVELSSRVLGKNLLAKSAPMYVRTSVLVTNLSVHFKRGQGRSLAWVTSLDTGAPVPNADISIYGCKGTKGWSGKTDGSGIAMVDEAQVSDADTGCKNQNFQRYVSARVGDDFAFTLDRWDTGIEPWRFGFEQNEDDFVYSSGDKLRAHTIFDRTLFKQGETVSMKHLIRWAADNALVLPPKKEMYFDELRIQHQGSDDVYTMALKWDERGEAVNSWAIPKSAKLGTYEVSLNSARGGSHSVGLIRVSDFKLPAYTASVVGQQGAGDKAGTFTVKSSLSYLNGGAAKGQPVKITLTMDNIYGVDSKKYEEFSFDFLNPELGRIPGKIQQTCTANAVLLDGVQRVTGKDGTDVYEYQLPDLTSPCLLTAELEFFDASGQTQTVQHSVKVWPRSFVLGVKAENRKLTIAALTPQGLPVAGVALSVGAKQSIVYSTRVRVVGGFYAYDHETKVRPLGVVCSGTTDAAGMLTCTLKAESRGNVSLTVRGIGSKGEVSATSTVLEAEGFDSENWEAPTNDNRMTLTPGKKQYRHGETAALTASLPFAASWALVTVERAGIISARVEKLTRQNPTVQVPIEKSWAPNVYVSVLAVRGRVSQGPSGEDLSPTAMVDLGKPTFRLGTTGLEIDYRQQQLKVDLSTDKTVYQPRETATVKVKVRTAEGKIPAAGTRVALAVVDSALLQLSPNPSFQMLEQMYQFGPLEVKTFTSQSQIIGKRHYGKKAVTFGGGGGRRPVRELFDSLVYWNPSVELNEQGEATVPVKLNDSLTQFEIAAAATSALDNFGNGKTTITAYQNLQMRPTLPTLIRVGDQYFASVSLRNASNSKRHVKLTGTASNVVLPMHELDLGPNETKEVGWKVAGATRPGTIMWKFSADAGKDAKDELQIRQTVEAPELPSLVASDLVKVGKSTAVTLGETPEAVKGNSFAEVHLTNSLVGDMAKVKSFFDTYPHQCAEQQTSRALGYADAARFSRLDADMASYIGDNNLLKYFPGEGQGYSDLTAYVLISAHSSGWEMSGPVKKRLLAGLSRYVAGQGATTSGRFDDRSRLYAMEALARYEQLDVKLLEAVAPSLTKLGPPELVSLYGVLVHVPATKSVIARKAAVEQELRNRLAGSGELSDETGYGWMYHSGFMANLRLLELAAKTHAFDADLPRIAVRMAKRLNSKGYFSTIDYGWSKLSLTKVQKSLNKEAVTGVTSIALAGMEKKVAWSLAPSNQAVVLPYGGSQSLSLKHEGAGSPYAEYQVFQTRRITKAESNGFELTKTLSAVRGDMSHLKRGDIVKVRLRIRALSAAQWVSVVDPVPAGATLMGETPQDGTTQPDTDASRLPLYPDYTEKGNGTFKAYFSQMSDGAGTLEYFIRVNVPGMFITGDTRVEAMYDGTMFARVPNRPFLVEQQ